MWVAWLWLLLATIGAHATLPVGSPIVRGNGSAFSAATVDVALAPKRKATGDEVTAERHRPGPDAAHGAGSDTGLASLPVYPVPLSRSWTRPASVPPPASDPDAVSTTARPFRARAPPAA